MSTRGAHSPLYVTKAGSGPSFTVRATIPNPSDDSAAGFEVGSELYSTAAQTHYVCVDATEGAAVWVRTNLQQGRNFYRVQPQIANVVYPQPQWAIEGTIATQVPAPGFTLRSGTFRTNYQNPLGASACARTDPAVFFRPSAAGTGGGVRLAEWWVVPNPDAPNDGFFFSGFSAANIPAGTDPTTLANVIGIGRRAPPFVGAADTELHMVTSDGTGAPTWTSMGPDFPTDDAQLCLLVSLYWANTATGVAHLQVERLDGFPGLFLADVAVNLPDLDTLMLWIVTCHDNTPAQVSFDLAYAEIEHL